MRSDGDADPDGTLKTVVRVKILYIYYISSDI
jgi:hypothetical protein